MDNTTSYVGAGYDPEQPQCNVLMQTSNINNSDISNQETLPLFPLLPSNSLENSVTPRIEKGSAHQPFFDFFLWPRIDMDGSGIKKTVPTFSIRI
ncbi:hypothetical protein WN943_026500 [Citrus x changshan-huyou]